MSHEQVQTATATLEVKSSRQAMDWALVLASQGIDCAVVEMPEAGWGLQVAEEDVPRSTVAIRAYEQENATVWRQEIKWTGMLFDWRALAWWLLMVLVFVLSTTRPWFKNAGVMDPVLFQKGQWWRAFTAVTLHADAAHLALNASTGFLLLGLAMGFYGSGIAMLAAFSAGALANFAEMFLRSENYSGLGASGMVMATLGLLAAQSLFERYHSPREWIGRGVLAAGLLLVIIGLDEKSDILVHLLGFAVGIFFGVSLCLSARRLLRRKALDAAASLVSAALLLLTWGLALRSAIRIP